MRYAYAISLFLLFQLSGLTAAAQASLGIGTNTPDPKAALDISATGKGLLIPRMDSATRAGISSPPDGLMVFQTDGRKGFWYAVSGAWVYIPDKTKSGDNLGNHTATQNLNLNGNKLTGGGTGGVSVTTDGHVGVGTSSPIGALQVAVTQLGDETIDQQNFGGVGPFLSSGQNNCWQSFTPTIAGLLSRLVVSMRSPLNSGASVATLNIFAGRGTAGTLLASQSITIGATYGPQSVPLPAPVSVVAGQEYTFQVLPPVASRSWFLVIPGNMYNNGVSGAGNDNDLSFATYVRSESNYDALAVMSSGQVGIGTSSPVATLDVSGNIRTNGFQLTSGAASGRVLTSDASGNATWQTAADASATNEIQTLSISGSTISLSNGGGSVTVPSSADNLGNHTATQNLNLGANLLTGGGTSGLRVTNSGQVGIGTAAPNGLLHLVGSETGTNGFAASLRLQNTAATTANTWTLRAGGAGTAAPDGGFSIADNNNYRLSITNAGLVGINTNTPAARLTVTGADATPNGKTAALMIQNTGATTANTWNLRAGGVGTNTPDGGFSIADDAAYRFTITSTGRVGIGTNSPAQALDVAGNLRLQGQSGTTERMLVADAQGDVQAARYFTRNGTIAGNDMISFVWTHNLGYQPVLLLSVEANDARVIATYEHISNNQTLIRVSNQTLILDIDYRVHAFAVR